MNKQDNRLGLSVVATLVAGIALVYTLIMFPQIIFAVAGISFIFIIAAFILTQNILIYNHQKEKASIQQIRDCIDKVSTQMETMGNSRSQIEKASQNIVDIRKQLHRKSGSTLQESDCIIVRTE